MSATEYVTTIYALASAAGRAGVAVFRISGPHALAALAELGVVKPLAPRKAVLATLTHKEKIIDQALVVFFPAPYSFTGEDVVELHTHGSRAVTKLLLEALSGISGLRLAEAGEFARRAFLAGKMDLAQAEGLADLIDAETSAQHTQATRQLGGGTSARVEALRMAALEPLALLEAYIDFPDEEIPPAVLAQTTTRTAELKKEISVLLEDRGIGERVRDGLEIVIIGPPNAGKSSLLNALAKRDIAIVSPEAGTTRDLIEVSMEMDGYAVTLIDTAGLRETSSAIEAEGIRRARHRAEHADISLYVHDIVSIAEFSIDIKAQEDKYSLILATKADLGALPALPFPAVPVSTRSEQGMDALISELRRVVHARMDSFIPPLITRARHREALLEAQAALNRFSLDNPLELACEELRLAGRAIGKITGKIAVDDVLDLVFSRFCIGK